MERKWYGYAADIKRNALLAEVERIKPLLPESSHGVLAKIEASSPVDKMDEPTLCNFVDLLSRSLPQYEALKETP